MTTAHDQTDDTIRHKNDLAENVAQEFLSATSDYFQSELRLVSSDYDCLNKMNAATFDKYKQMNRTLEHVNNTIQTMNNSNNAYMLSTDAQLNEIEDAMSNFESTLKHLDAYSRCLESQVKKFEKTLSIKGAKS